MVKKIVFLDDSKSILKTITYAVEELVNDGVITIETYNDSEAFVTLIENESLEFDILFSDINMPGASGYHVAKLLRTKEKYQSKMVIALTTEISDESKKLGKAAGFNGWITKISSPEVMKSTIVNTIRTINAKGL